MFSQQYTGLVSGIYRLSPQPLPQPLNLYIPLTCIQVSVYRFRSRYIVSGLVRRSRSHLPRLRQLLLSRPPV
jgi:hypothetical protein